MIDSETKFNAMLAMTDFGGQEVDWYSRKSEKKLTYNLALRLVIEYDMDYKQAIDASANFHKYFHDTVIKKKD